MSQKQTRVEKIISDISLGQLFNLDVPVEERQEILDDLTPIILRHVSPQDLLDHNQKVYDVTAKQYKENPHNPDVIDEIITFMSMLPSGARVLDVGCGFGRDTCFMATNNQQNRLSVMKRSDKNGRKTCDKFPAPDKKFEMIGIDTSPIFLQHAQEHAKVWGLSLVFIYGDMHNIEINGLGGCTEYFDGVWSCTALFTHTPWVLLEPAIVSATRVLKPGGIFFASYTNGLADGGRYDRLLVSSTGHVKYFSQPDPSDIARIAKKYGLRLLEQIFSDFIGRDGVVKENLFVSQFFKKEAQ